MASTERATFRQPSFNSSMIPSPADLLLALPRLFSFTFHYLPEQLDDLFSMAKSPGRVVPDATSKAAISNSSMMPSGTPFVQNPGSAALKSSHAVASAGFFSFVRNFSLSESISNLDGIFSYIASRWAISTFLIAVILNRAHVYASSRRHLRLNWESRLIMRVVPILLFMYQVERILQALRCQTGPMIAEAHNADSGTLLNGSFTNEGGPFYMLSSTLLFWQTESDSCRAAGMIQPDNQAMAVGSSSLLWPLFLSLCISHFIETVSCALQGRQPMAETGMTIFEHSLAFAEAEAVVRSSIGLGLFGLPKEGQVSEDTMSKLATLSRSMVMQKLNVPPEVLLIALISSMSHLTSHILAVFRLQSRCRLVNTFIWGTCFMGAFLWSFVRFSYSGTNPNLAVIRYPTVCVIGFIPHFLVMVGIALCGTIYVISLMLTLLSPPTSQHARGSFRERLLMARNNLQASAALSNIHISWRDEFYTTLMKVGFSILTAASEAVYFNEGTKVTVANQTWLENQWHSEMAAKANAISTRRKNAAFVPPEIQGSVVAEGLSMVDEPPDMHNTRNVSGFATERKAGKAGPKIGAAATREEGVGRSQYHGRAHLSVTFVTETLKLIARCQAKLTLAILGFAGIGWSPRWLRALARTHVRIVKQQASSAPSPLEFWMLSEDGSLRLPSGTSVDVEMETRKRLGTRQGQDEDEERIDRNLYRWWQNGGFWGELDGSGDYEPSLLDNEDATSIISTAATSEAGSDSALSGDEDDDGRTTPTPQNHRDTTPDLLSDETLHRLSRLLAPKTLEDRHEARILGRHLNREGAMTRSQYNRLENSERLALLGKTPGGTSQDGTAAAAPMSAEEEEEELLEQLVRSRRQQRSSAPSPASAAVTDSADAASWTQGAEGMGAEGPQCVVCRSAPRTILVWPCRCLSLCEECRVSLAMNNFANCVCCRREVVAFSRLFVP